MQSNVSTTQSQSQSSLILFFLHSFSQHHTIPPLSFPVQSILCIRVCVCVCICIWVCAAALKRWLEQPMNGESCGEEMDGSEPTAVSSNCKILVTLDCGLWLMELIWRLPSPGPPLSSGGREGRTVDPGRRWGRERKARGLTSRATSDWCKRETFWLIINWLYERVMGFGIVHIDWVHLQDFNKIKVNLLSLSSYNGHV